MVLSPTKKPKETGRSFTLLNTRLPDVFKLDYVAVSLGRIRFRLKTFKENRPEELTGLIIGHCKPH